MQLNSQSFHHKPKQLVLSPSFHLLMHKDLLRPGDHCSSLYSPWKNPKSRFYIFKWLKKIQKSISWYEMILLYEIQIYMNSFIGTVILLFTSSPWPAFTLYSKADWLWQRSNISQTPKYLLSVIYQKKLTNFSMNTVCEELSGKKRKWDMGRIKVCSCFILPIHSKWGNSGRFYITLRMLWTQKPPLFRPENLQELKIPLTYAFSNDTKWRQIQSTDTPPATD